MMKRTNINRRTLAKTAGALAGGAAIARIAPATAQEATPAAEVEPYQLSPWWPYLSAHINDENPPDILGDPIIADVTQDNGPAFWVFPGPRELDPTVFGTPENPIGTERPPFFLGLPTEFREVTEDGVYQTSQPTPFSDKFAAVEGATLRMHVVDQTAIDGATTKDEIDFEATFPAPEDQGEYRVTVSEPAPHGWVFPTGGGVVSNVFLHGVTGWGTRLMPTEFTYSAFWGSGDIYHNDELVAENTSIHMMLTEFVRKEPYDLVFDEGVNPNSRHLHLMVLPFTLKGEHKPVPTGFMLPNGMEQPFLHVMFPALTVETPPSQQ